MYNESPQINIVSHFTLFDVDAYINVNIEIDYPCSIKYYDLYAILMWMHQCSRSSRF